MRSLDACCCHCRNPSSLSPSLVSFKSGNNLYTFASAAPSYSPRRRPPSPLLGHMGTSLFACVPAAQMPSSHVLSCPVSLLSLSPLCSPVTLSATRSSLPTAHLGTHSSLSLSLPVDRDHLPGALLIQLVIFLGPPHLGFIL